MAAAFASMSVAAISDEASKARLKAWSWPSDSESTSVHGAACVKSSMGVISSASLSFPVRTSSRYAFTPAANDVSEAAIARSRESFEARSASKPSCAVLRR
jgi:hypothetical protein